jgi:hypothetical protein
VSFRISTETDCLTNASHIASAFRADMHASGNRVLPALFGRQAVWVSWYRNRFHLVRFADAGEGRIIARLKSRIALQGLAWLLDDWLRAKNAEVICWAVIGDSMSESSTPM